VGKNRLHLDLVTSGSMQAEVRRLESLGATRIDIGQPDDQKATWAVMADPEGSEFCVLSSRDQ